MKELGLKKYSMMLIVKLQRYLNYHFVRLMNMNTMHVINNYFLIKQTKYDFSSPGKKN